MSRNKIDQSSSCAIANEGLTYLDGLRLSRELSRITTTKTSAHPRLAHLLFADGIALVWVHRASDIMDVSEMTIEGVAGHERASRTAPFVVRITKTAFATGGCARGDRKNVGDVRAWPGTGSSFL